MKKLRIAVDFDGTLCEYAFPKIGEQTPDKKELMEMQVLQCEAIEILIENVESLEERVETLEEENVNPIIN